MSNKYGKRIIKHRRYVLYTFVTAILLSIVFFSMVSYLYNKAEEEAYETLHVQTKQVKDDLVLQLISDRENLSTMASFAAKLYSDGDDYSLLFDSFKPIGMIENIGILNPDNTFSTKAGTSDLSDVFSFEDEKAKGSYISGRIMDVTNTDYELIRSAVPIVVNDKTVGILYGAIKPDKLGKRYKDITEELHAQLFVYEKESGDILIDTVHDNLGNISFLNDRKYHTGYSFEEFMSTDKGFTAFESAYRNESIHLHYSTIDELNWMIAMGRYDSEVLAGAHMRAMVFTIIYIIMLGIIVLYVLFLMMNERKINSIAECAANVRKELLETTEGENNIQDALFEVCKFAKSRSAIFFDTNGEMYHYIAPGNKETIISTKERQYFFSELIRYSSEFSNNNDNRAVSLMCIRPDMHMQKTNPHFFKLLKEHSINEISLSATINRANHIAVLATINSQKSAQVRMLAEKISACFSMALYNKNHLNTTLHAAITDALTGAFNRVAYKNDLKVFDEEKPSDFSCIYIDVNELHLCNNKFGHAAGDAMLLYIANTLKEVFYGYKVYRLGGDEFLVLCQNLSKSAVEKKINTFQKQLEPRNYHVAIGMSYRTQNIETEEMVREAELKMYEKKAEYYQNKDKKTLNISGSKDIIQFKTGIAEYDAVLSVLKEKYNGIYRVSLDTDQAKYILMPAYFNYNEKEEPFSKVFSKYVEESVDRDYHRAVLSFLNYETLKTQLLEDKNPKISFKKNNGEFVVLSIYKLGDSPNSISDCLWVFSKE